MSTSIRALHPDIRVTLYKLIKRTTVNGTLAASARYQESGRRIDLTPYLSDLAGTVHTTKSTRAPAGAFALTFSDRPHPAAGTLETLYGLVEPMDGIEIRMSHNHGQINRVPPVVMRGFVSRVGRSQSVDQSGAPMRTVTVEGHDYGKLWQMLQVLRRPWFSLGEAWLSSFPLFERFGIAIQSEKPAGDFVKEVIDKVLNPHLAGMIPDDWPMPRELKVENLVTQGVTSVTGPQNAEGSIYTILATFADVTSGFNELYIEDRAEETVVVYRPNPAIDLDGQPIQEVEGTPVRPTLPATDIMQLDLSRSDADVANYFWVEDSRFEMVREFTLQFAAATSAQRESVFMENHPNNDPKLYGMRPMIVSSQMGPGATFQVGQDDETHARRDGEITRWLDERRRILGMTNRDNVLLEQGSARIAGNENIRAGQHITIGRGALAAPYYVAAVSHDYVTFKGFFTTLQLERGQGFAKRIQAGSATAPYLVELGAGAPAGTAPPAAGNAATARNSTGQAGASGTPDGGAGQAAPPDSTATQG